MSTSTWRWPVRAFEATDESRGERRHEAAADTDDSAGARSYRCCNWYSRPVAGGRTSIGYWGKEGETGCRGGVAINDSERTRTLRRTTQSPIPLSTAEILTASTKKNRNHCYGFTTQSSIAPRSSSRQSRAVVRGVPGFQRPVDRHTPGSSPIAAPYRGGVAVREFDACVVKGVSSIGVPFGMVGRYRSSRAQSIIGTRNRETPEGPSPVPRAPIDVRNFAPMIDKTGRLFTENENPTPGQSTGFVGGKPPIDTRIIFLLSNGCLSLSFASKRAIGDWRDDENRLTPIEAGSRPDTGQ